MRRLQILIGFVTLIGASAPSVSAHPIALVGGRLIDGFGGPPLANSVILIDEERITAVGQVGKLEVPKGVEVISTEGMDVLPGLWDCHVHTMLLGHSDYTHWDKTYPKRLASEIMPAAGHQLLMAGVTSARDLGAPHAYLLTTTAEEFFPKFGFERVERTDVPASVQTSIEFRSACPSSAIVMRKAL